MTGALWDTDRPTRCRVLLMRQDNWDGRRIVSLASYHETIEAAVAEGQKLTRRGLGVYWIVAPHQPAHRRTT